MKFFSLNWKRLVSIIKCIYYIYFDKWLFKIIFVFNSVDIAFKLAWFLLNWWFKWKILTNDFKNPTAGLWRTERTSFELLNSTDNYIACLTDFNICQSNSNQKCISTLNSSDNRFIRKINDEIQNYTFKLADMFITVESQLPILRQD